MRKYLYLFVLSIACAFSLSAVQLQVIEFETQPTPLELFAKGFCDRAEEIRQMEQQFELMERDK